MIKHLKGTKEYTQKNVFPILPTPAAEDGLSPKIKHHHQLPL